MNKPTDEILMAFADGELEVAKHQEIEALISSDREVAERYKIYAETKDPIARLFTERASEVVPQDLVSLIQNYDARSQVNDKTAAGSHGLVRSFRDLFRGVTQALAAPQFALAGVAGAFLLGIGVGTFASFSTDMLPNAAERGQLVGLHRPSSPLGSALETKLSGATAQLASDGDVSTSFKAVFSFLGRDGRFCRQYLLQRSDGKALQGVACRTVERDWNDRIRVATEVKKSAGFKPASNARNQQIESVVDRLIEGNVLEAKDERKLITQGWRKD